MSGRQQTLRSGKWQKNLPGVNYPLMRGENLVRVKLDFVGESNHFVTKCNTRGGGKVSEERSPITHAKIPGFQWFWTLDKKNNLRNIYANVLGA